MENGQTTQEVIRFCFRGVKEVDAFSEKTMTRLLKIARTVHGGVKKIVSTIHKEPEQAHGKMTVKQLIRKDEGATSVDISKTELRDFQKVAKRYGVDFAVVKHKGQDPPVYSVFFKARDQDAITDVIRYYTEKKLMKAQKPSLHEKIKEMKEKIANAPKKVMNRAKERSR